MLDYIVVPLGELLTHCDEDKVTEVFNTFVCEREYDLETFLKKRSVSYEKHGHGKTYLFLDSKALCHGRIVVVAYFTLSHSAINVSKMTGKRKKDALGQYPGRDKLEYAPAFLIGQLGRSDNYTHDDLPGSELIKECYYQLAQVSKIIGGQLLVLDCRTHMFDNFYSKQNFKQLYKEADDKGLWTVFRKINFNEYLI